MTLENKALMFEIRTEDSVAVATLAANYSRVTGAGYVHRFGEELFEIVEQRGVTRLALSFRHCEFLSSGALNKLLIFDRKMKVANGQYVLCDMVDSVHSFFIITRFDQLFTIKDTLEEALESLAH